MPSFSASLARVGYGFIFFKNSLINLRILNICFHDKSETLSTIAYQCCLFLSLLRQMPTTIHDFYIDLISVYV